MFSLTRTALLVVAALSGVLGPVRAGQDAVVLFVDEAGPENLSEGNRFVAGFRKKVEEVLTRSGARVVEARRLFRSNGVAFDKQTRLSGDLVLKALGKIPAPRPDIVAGFSVSVNIVQSGETFVPVLRFAGSAVRAETGRVLGTFALKPARLSALPKACDRRCLTGAIETQGLAVAAEAGEKLAVLLTSPAESEAKASPAKAAPSGCASGIVAHEIDLVNLTGEEMRDIERVANALKCHVGHRFLDIGTDGKRLVLELAESRDWMTHNIRLLAKYAAPAASVVISDGRFVIAND